MTIAIVALARQRFEALAGCTRSPASDFFVEELAWYADEQERLLSVVQRDKSDNDFVAVVLGRDEIGRFRAIDLESGLESPAAAQAWAERTMRWHLRDGASVFPQDDAEREPLDLLKPAVPHDKLHPDFIRLISDDRLLSARKIIAEIAPHFIDIDGNFVEQFQTTGFDARLWELYLYRAFAEEALFLDREHDRPDFLLTKYGKSVAVEATIVGRRKDRPARYLKQPEELSPEEIQRRSVDEMPLRFGSPLHSKKQKRYWELPHLKGLPLVFAIADFHDDRSMLWSSSSLISFLYGIRHSHHFEDGKLIIDPEPIGTHRKGNVEVPSGFFLQPDSEYVSAVMFSASGTISKFNRMGRQAGFTAPNVRVFRSGTHHDHNPDAHLPKQFFYQVTEESQESWTEGLSLFHNPSAKYPVPEELFPSFAHHRLEGNQIVSMLPEFHPYGSVTINMKFGP